MNENDLIQALGVPVLMFLVTLFKKGLRLSGAPRDAISPIVLVALGLVYGVVSHVPLSQMGWVVAAAFAAYKVIRAAWKKKDVAGPAVLLLCAGLLFASPARAQLSDLTLSVGGQQTILRGGGESQTIDALLASVEYQTKVDSVGRHLIGIGTLFAEDQFAGAGVTYYYGVRPSRIYLTIGVGALIIRPDEAEIPARSVFGGAEASVEIWKRVEPDSFLPVSAFVGYYPISDQDFGFEVWRFGVRVKTDVVAG